MELNLETLRENIEAAIESNPECGGNILLQSRVFFREEGSRPEILVSLNNKTKRPHYWGHIFWHEGRYVSCIIAVDFWLSPFSTGELFEEFWKNLTDLGWWYPIAGDVFATAKSIKEAGSHLIAMIKVFSSDWEAGEFDYRVVQVYPFPDPFKEYA